MDQHSVRLLLPQCLCAKDTVLIKKHCRKEIFFLLTELLLGDFLVTNVAFTVWTNSVVAYEAQL